MKKEYMKPEVTVVELQYRRQLLLTTSTETLGLSEEDKLIIDDSSESIGDSFWGR